VRIDRTGADLELAGGDHETVAGDHDVVHKLPTGGTSQRRLQMRAEDSWERNAEAVADALHRLVRSAPAELVLVMGDVRAVALLERYASDALASRLVRLDTGGRAPGTSATAEQEAVDEALALHRASREAALVDRFAEQLNRQQDAVDGLADVVDVLARGQVEELLLVDDRAATTTVRVVRSTGHVVVPGQPESDADDLDDVVDVPAGDALVWQAVRTRAGVTLVDPHQVRLRDGVGALLRWSDRTTPHAAAPAMPGHGQPPGMTANEE
jgi:hypothetical protein